MTAAIIANLAATWKAKMLKLQGTTRILIEAQWVVSLLNKLISVPQLAFVAISIPLCCAHTKTLLANYLKVVSLSDLPYRTRNGLLFWQNDP